MSALDRLPENSLTSLLTEARQISRELKGAAQTTGSANLAFITTASANERDWTGQLDGPVGHPAYSQARFVITLKAELAIVPMVDLAIVVFYSTDGVNWQEYTYRRGLQEAYGGIAPEIWRTLLPLPGSENAPGEVKFSFQLFGVTGAPVAFKCQAVGSDEVTINIARIA